jgi:hypothetical protein
VRGALVYNVGEYSFRYEIASPELVAERAGTAGRTSLTIGTLQIELGVATGNALFVWGLHPKAMWTTVAVSPPGADPGIVHFDGEFEAAVSESLAEVGQWTTRYDAATGWVRVASAEIPDESLTEIATGVVLGANGGELSSVWLKPAFE